MHVSLVQYCQTFYSFLTLCYYFTRLNAREISHRSSNSQMFFKIGCLKNFAIFTKKDSPVLESEVAKYEKLAKYLQYCTWHYAITSTFFLLRD